MDASGRLVIPKALRDRLGLRPGSVELEVAADRTSRSDTAHVPGGRSPAGGRLPDPAHLSAEAARSLLQRLPELGISGGSVYDALVGAAAVEHRRPLVTSDRRALPAYLALDVDVVLVE